MEGSITPSEDNKHSMQGITQTHMQLWAIWCSRSIYQHDLGGQRKTVQPVKTHVDTLTTSETPD